MRARDFYAGLNHMTHGAIYALAQMLSIFPHDLYAVYQSLKASGLTFTQLDQNIS